MAKYQVSLIEFPSGWQPESPDDVPPAPARPTGVLAQTDDLFSAVRKAIEHNEATAEEAERRWAVVVEPGCCGRIWPGARLCTPLHYKVAAIWWPTGWEPRSPLDVPNCVWRAQGEPNDEVMPYTRALATVQALNHQGMNIAASQWFVVIACRGRQQRECSQSGRGFPPAHRYGRVTAGDSARTFHPPVGRVSRPAGLSRDFPAAWRRWRPGRVDTAGCRTPPADGPAPSALGYVPYPTRRNCLFSSQSSATSVTFQ